MKTRQSAVQFFEVIAWRRPQIPIGGGVVDHLKLAKQLGFQIGRDSSISEIVDEEASQPSSRKLTIMRPSCG
jgi:hypothetical protein